MHRVRQGLMWSLLMSYPYTGSGTPVLRSFDSSPPFGSAEAFHHQMPGGQYTNLREQATALGLVNVPMW